MGVITQISLEEINLLFPSFEFTRLDKTNDGIMDTTYIVSNKIESYILKKYERDIQNKINRDKKLLLELNAVSLNVPTCLDEHKGWYLYKKLEGTQPKNIKLQHIQELARFMAKLHKRTKDYTCKSMFVEDYDLNTMLLFVKRNYFSYYKKLQTLHNYKQKIDGFIHGDIFKDNTVFHKSKIGVFDFIDSGCGEFIFDIAVALLSFNPKNKTSFNTLFLKTYNQSSLKKITPSELQKTRKEAALFYALLRIENSKNTSRAKELIFR